MLTGLVGTSSNVEAIDEVPNQVTLPDFDGFEEWELISISLNPGRLEREVVFKVYDSNLKEDSDPNSYYITNSTEIVPEGYLSIYENFTTLNNGFKMVKNQDQKAFSPYSEFATYLGARLKDILEKGNMFQINYLKEDFHINEPNGSNKDVSNMMRKVISASEEEPFKGRHAMPTTEHPWFNGDTAFGVSEGTNYQVYFDGSNESTNVAEMVLPNPPGPNEVYYPSFEGSKKGEPSGPKEHSLIFNGKGEKIEFILGVDIRLSAKPELHANYNDFAITDITPAPKITVPLWSNNLVITTTVEKGHELDLRGNLLGDRVKVSAKYKDETVDLGEVNINADGSWNMELPEIEHRDVTYIFTPVNGYSLLEGNEVTMFRPGL